jgi:thiamine-phosphate pyrophosphorylase
MGSCGRICRRTNPSGVSVATSDRPGFFFARCAPGATADAGVKEDDMKFDPFYPIFPDADWIERMLPLGVRFVQLRVKDRDEDATREEIARAQAACAAAGALLVVNDHWQLAIEEGCGFVHLGQEDLDDADVPTIRGAGLGLGISTHDVPELERALALAPDYVALGPVFATRLKAMRFAPQGLERLAEWRRRVGDLPLVAIGGFTVPRAAMAFRAGADVVSVVTDITLDHDPQAKVRAWVEATRATDPV